MILREQAVLFYQNTQNLKKNHENSSRNKDFRVIFKNAGPKGSPGFERVLRGYFFQKTGFAVRASFSSIFKIETSNKLHCVGN